MKRQEEERIRLEKEELERIAKEEEELTPWKTRHENNLSQAYKRIIEAEDWAKNSNCEDGYINVADQKQMNGFIFEFKEKCDTNFINNFKLIEKDEADEFQSFNYSQLHYRNLERLLLQGRATLQRRLINYSFDYLMEIKRIEMMKIESITRYFIENFQKLKEKRNKELKELGKATGEIQICKYKKKF